MKRKKKEWKKERRKERKRKEKLRKTKRKRRDRKKTLYKHEITVFFPTELVALDTPNRGTECTKISLPVFVDEGSSGRQNLL